ncbi:hypothetical protein CEE37_06800 [candidate division LCP-89 bacterium B3_LCP]|uniref:T9SS type A sorting domain-containing protein n=1 Tax=candidate division LCP-89 bacterium B3_LCP TaxID=2012998 RepID=A0A532V0C6_UNCL8|nr:MAG: hypothetical protein CEE37_06800 [candidate division LCP-89 bacterium B3_LCP]
MLARKVIIVLCSLVALNVNASWINLDSADPVPPKIEVTESDAYGVTFDVEIKGFYNEDTTVNDVEYQVLWFYQSPSKNADGHPDIPFLYRLINIPDGGSITVDVSVTDSTILNDYYVYPSSKAVVDTSTGHSKQEFCRIDSLYQLEDFYPDTKGKIKNKGDIRDQPVGSVHIYPFSFNPDDSTLKVLTEFTVEVSFSQALSSFPGGGGFFGKILEHSTANYTSSAGGRTIYSGDNGSVTRYSTDLASWNSSRDCDYLIITGDYFFNGVHSIDEIANYHANREKWDIAIVNWDDIDEQVSTQSDDWIQLRDFIEIVYDENVGTHMDDGKLGFALLIGDADPERYRVPRNEAWDDEMGESGDHFYCMLTHDTSYVYDIYPDIILGRISVHDTTDLRNVVEKITDYPNLQPDGEKTRLCFVDGGSTPEEFGVFQESAMQVILNIVPVSFYTYYSYVHIGSAHSLATVSVLAGTTTQSCAKILDPIYEDGCLALTYMGHGLEQDWWNPGTPWERLFGVEELQEEEIDDEYPIILSISCLTGAFDDEDDCMAEAFMNQDNGACVSFLGASSTMPQASVATFLPWIFSYIFSPSTPNSVIGEAIFNAKIECAASAPNPGYYYWLKPYNLYGDPAFNPFVDESETITTNTTWKGMKCFYNDVVVSDNAVLTIDTAAVILFADGCGLKVENGAYLDIISFDTTYVTFAGIGSAEWEGIKLADDASSSSVIKYCDIKNATYGIQMDSTADLTASIRKNTFTDCDYGIYAYETGTDIDSCEFEYCREAAIKLVSYDGDVSYNTIVMGDTSYGIWAQSCTHADLIADTIRNSSDESQAGDVGIYLYNSTGIDIEGCYLSDGAYSQIDCINSGPYLKDNILEDGSRNGMRIYNNSQPVMTTSVAGENRIADHDSSEIYIHGYKYPFLRNGHNDLADEDDPSSPSSMGEYLIAADFDANDLPQEGYTANVDSNWWYAGEVLDDTSEVHDHLYPANTGDYRIWVVAIDGASNTGYSTSGSTIQTPEEFFLDAVVLEDQGQYQQAYNAFEDVMDDYPDDPAAIAAGQHLFSCALALGTSMSTLETYYANLALNATCDDFERNWLNMASYCQVENGDFDDAMTYYESVISSTTSSFTDSVYAEIDAGAAYMRSQIQSGQLYSSGMRTLFGSIAHLCPDSHQEYEAKVKNLLNLLSGDTGADVGQPTLPSKFALYQNYPNPFNPATSIRYDLPEMSDVTLKIFNIMGRHVTTLVDKRETAGFKRLVWKGTNDYGAEVASGLYIIQMVAKGETAGKYVSAKKMLLLK